jgi:hypothetical protein
LAGQTFDREAQRSVRKSALHEVAFYSDNGALLNDYGRFAASALNTGKVLIVASGLILRPALDQELTSRGIDVARITREGRFRWFDVSDVLSSFVVENRLDERRFWEVVPPLIMEAARASTADPPRVAAWGEAAPTLWQTGHVEAAIRLEQLWDELVRICDVDVFCPYPAKGAEDSSAYERLCAAHSVVHA